MAKLGLQITFSKLSPLEMNQQLPLLSLFISILTFNSPVTLVEFRSFENQPNEFLLTDDTPSNHLIGKVQTPQDASITFPPTISTDSANRQLWCFQIFRPHKLPGLLFRIDSESGELYTLQNIDRDSLCAELKDTECILTFQITAQSKSNPGVPHFIDVKIFLEDRNDHRPEFPEPGFVNLSVQESTKVGTRFPLPLASDADSQQYCVSAYVAEPEMPSEWSLIAETAETSTKIANLYLKLEKPLDYETKKKFTFRIKALDGPEVNDFVQINNRKDILQVYIHVEDVNDNGPVFRKQERVYSLPLPKAKLSDWIVTYTATVPESEWMKDPILKLIADDMDGPENSKVRYYFAPTTSKQVQEYFALNPLSGYLFLRKPLDYEYQSEYSFRVIATDMQAESRLDGALNIQSSPTLSNYHTAIAEVVILVTDTNDENPEIEVDFLSTEPRASLMPVKYAEIDENATPPQFIASIQATDRDAGLNGQVGCLQQSVINLAQPIVGIRPRPTPEINASSSSFQLDEIRRENGRVQYRLLTREALDREDMENGGAYRQVKIVCTDMGQPSRTSSTFVNIRIRDKNDNAPIVNIRRPPDYIYGLKHLEDEMWPFVYENAPAGSLVTRLNASDLDEGENGRLKFSFVAEDPPAGMVNPLRLFQINEKSGDITTRIQIDREAYDPPLSSVVLLIKVSDNGVPPRSAIQKVKIYIRDVNDNSPVFQRSEYQFHVMENLPAGHAIGEIVVTDKDESEIKVSFGLQTYGPLPFTIWPSPFQSEGGHNAYPKTRFLINTTRPLDREVEHHFKFVLLATDGPGVHGRVDTATATVEVIVENENDNDPVIIFPQKQNKTFYLSWREKKNFELLTINANDKDPPESPHIFEIIKDTSDIPTNNYSGENETKVGNEFVQSSDFLDIEPTTGTVFLSRDMKSEDKGMHVFKVKVTDAGVPPRSTSITFFVLVEGSKPRTPIHQSKVSITKTYNKTAADIDISLLRELRITTMENRVEHGSQPLEIRPKLKPRIAADLFVILALGLIFLLLIATLGLVVFFRCWKKQTRQTQRNGNRGSLLFANQGHRDGSTRMKEIRIPSVSQQDQWLCTSDGSIFNISSQSQFSTEGEQLKGYVSNDIPSAECNANIYYKITVDTTGKETGRSNNTTAYSPLSPLSVSLKSRSMPDYEGYIHQDFQPAYYAQNVLTSGAQHSDCSVYFSHKGTVNRNTFANTSALKQQKKQKECLVISPVTWDCQSRRNSLKREGLLMIPSTEGAQNETNVSPFCYPFA